MMFNLLTELYLSSLNDKYDPSKNSERAKKVRKRGNQFYTQKNYIQALKNYNQSIALSNAKEDLALGYGNRSIVYFEMECYEECLQNIELARENGYQNAAKLDEREKKCKEKLEEQKGEKFNPWEFYKLSYKANEQLPFIIDGLEIRKTGKYGNGIYTTRDLKIGDIICVEQPEVFISNIVAHHMTCANCFDICKLNLMPCPKNSQVMFCSKDCMDTFYSKILDVDEMFCDGIALLSPIVRGFGGVKEFNKFAKRTNLKELDKTIFDFDLSNPNDPDYKKNLAMCLLSIKRNPKGCEQNICHLNDYVSKQSASHISGIIHNAFEDKTVFEGKDDYPERKYISFFQNLLNHSCENNAEVFPVINKIIVIVTNPIKAGEQIFVDYLNGITKDRKKIVKIMQEKKSFTCDCRECTDPNYKIKRIRMLDVGDLVNEKDMTGALNYMKDLFQNLQEIPNDSPMYLPAKSFAFSFLYHIASFSAFSC